MLGHWLRSRTPLGRTRSLYLLDQFCVKMTLNTTQIIIIAAAYYYWMKRRSRARTISHRRIVKRAVWRCHTGRERQLSTSPLLDWSIARIAVVGHVTPTSLALYRPGTFPMAFPCFLLFTTVVNSIHPCLRFVPFTTSVLCSRNRFSQPMSPLCRADLLTEKL